MRNSVVAAVQMDCEPMNTQHNMDIAFSLIRNAKKMGAELAVLPHMFTTGYNTFLHPNKVAEEINGPTANFLKGVAQKLKIHLVGGFVEKSRDKFFDTTLAIDSKGKIICSYRRVSLWPDEQKDMTRGDELCIVDLPFGHAGLLVSRDYSIPEIARTLAFEGCEILLITAAMEDHADWEVFVRSRAMENGCFAVAANRIGIEGVLSYCGHSMIVDPAGKVLADSEARQEIAVAELESERISRVRNDEWQLDELEESFGLESGEYLSEPMTCKRPRSGKKKKRK